MLGKDMAWIEEDKSRQDVDGVQVQFEYFTTYLMGSWRLALRSMLLLEANRAAEALVAIEQAFALLNSAPPRPRVHSLHNKSMGHGLDMYPKDLVDWHLLRAAILTRLGDPRAQSAWALAVVALNSPPMASEHDVFFKQQAAGKAKWHRTHSRGSAYKELATVQASAPMEGKESNGKGLEYIDGLLREREAIRSTFEVESHKRGYLASNKRLYERYLDLSMGDSDRNLLGMERAKSRAMVDLMAEGVSAVNDPTLQMVDRYRKIAAASALMKPDQRMTRGIDIAAVDRGLNELKRSAPELHSLVSVDVAGAAELESLLGPDTVALSYYVSDHTLYINAMGKGVRKVIGVPVSKSVLFGAVYDYRQALLGNGKGIWRKGSVSVKWTIKNNISSLALVNNLPFELEIRNVFERRTRLIMLQQYPYLPLGPKVQSLATSMVESVAPGKTAVVSQFDHNEIETISSYTHPSLVEIFIETNLGNVQASGTVLYKNGVSSLTVNDVQSFSYAPMEESLYDVLIKPVEREIKGKRLVIVPHNVLHFLPFEALKSANGKYLIQDHAVSYVPSLNTLRLSRAKNRGKPTSLVAYGDSLGDLAFARAEVLAVSRFFEKSMVLSGRDVTYQAVQESMGSGDVIHFACHGVFNSSLPLDSGLVLSVSPTARGKTSRDIPVAHSLLTVPDIMSIKSNSSLVFLSACDTGKARVSGGDELIGLTRGFFVAGSPSLVTTLWPIDDQSTGMLAERFYENLFKHNMDKREALREAKLHIIEEGYNAPEHWAAFVLQGDWQ